MSNNLRMNIELKKSLLRDSEDILRPTDYLFAGRLAVIDQELPVFLKQP